MYSGATRPIIGSTATSFSLASGQALSIRPGGGMTRIIIGVPRLLTTPPTMATRTTATMITRTTGTPTTPTGRIRASRAIRPTRLTARRIAIHIKAVTALRPCTIRHLHRRRGLKAGVRRHLRRPTSNRHPQATEEVCKDWTRATSERCRNIFWPVHPSIGDVRLSGFVGIARRIDRAIPFRDRKREGRHLIDANQSPGNSPA